MNQPTNNAHAVAVEPTLLPPSAALPSLPAEYGIPPLGDFATHARDAIIAAARAGQEPNEKTVERAGTTESGILAMIRGNLADNPGAAAAAEAQLNAQMQVASHVREALPTITGRDGPMSETQIAASLLPPETMAALGLGVSPAPAAPAQVGPVAMTPTPTPPAPAPAPSSELAQLTATVRHLAELQTQQYAAQQYAAQQAQAQAQAQAAQAWKDPAYRDQKLAEAGIDVTNPEVLALARVQWDDAHRNAETQAQLAAELQAMRGELARAHAVEAQRTMSTQVNAYLAQHFDHTPPQQRSAAGTVVMQLMAAGIPAARAMEMATATLPARPQAPAQAPAPAPPSPQQIQQLRALALGSGGAATPALTPPQRAGLPPSAPSAFTPPTLQEIDMAVARGLFRR